MYDDVEKAIAAIIEKYGNDPHFFNLIYKELLLRPEIVLSWIKGGTFVPPYKVCYTLIEDILNTLPYFYRVYCLFYVYYYKKDGLSLFLRTLNEYYGVEISDRLPDFLDIFEGEKDKLSEVPSSLLSMFTIDAINYFIVDNTRYKFIEWLIYEWQNRDDRDRFLSYKILTGMDNQYGFSFYEDVVDKIVVDYPNIYFLINRMIPHLFFKRKVMIKDLSFFLFVYPNEPFSQEIVLNEVKKSYFTNRYRPIILYLLPLLFMSKMEKEKKGLSDNYKKLLEYINDFSKTYLVDDALSKKGFVQRFVELIMEGNTSEKSNIFLEDLIINTHGLENMIIKLFFNRMEENDWIMFGVPELWEYVFRYIFMFNENIYDDIYKAMESNIIHASNLTIEDFMVKYVINYEYYCDIKYEYDEKWIEEIWKYVYMGEKQRLLNMMYMKNDVEELHYNHLRLLILYITMEYYCDHVSNDGILRRIMNDVKDILIMYRHTIIPAYLKSFEKKNEFIKDFLISHIKNRISVLLKEGGQYDNPTYQ